MTSVSFTLPFPAKCLWPNGRAHWSVKAKAVKSHRLLARVQARIATGWHNACPDSPVAIAVTVHPKTRNPIDRDNCVAALKSYLDGIADALGVDDRLFETPVIIFGEPVKGGLFAVTLTYEPANPEQGQDA